MATVEQLQILILQTLDKQNVIENTKDLTTLDNQPLDQLLVLGALNSLKSKDVNIILFHYYYYSYLYSLK